MEVVRSALSPLLVIITLAVSQMMAPVVRAAEPQDFAHDIDGWVQPLHWGPAAPPQHESLLLRRTYLTLLGLPPTLDELNRYLADQDPERYRRTVDELLSRPEFIEHWAEKLDVMLMERRANTHIPQDQWMQWLRDQLTANRPLHQLLADLLVADGTPGSDRPAARFLLDRGADPHLITRDLGRIYFGRDLQCAQCHDHPSVDSYLQTDYQGLLGFVAAVQAVEVTDGEHKLQVVAEKAAADAPFESVFRRGAPHRVLPHLFGEDEFAQPWAIPGEEYQAGQPDGHPAKPRHSRRGQLADAIRAGGVEPFNRNLANRLWAMVYGRGVVEPVDWQHSANPPVSDQLLSGLSERLVELNFDLRGFVRDLLLSDSYRRGALPIDYQTAEPAAWWSAVIESARANLAANESQAVQSRQTRNELAAAFKAALAGMAAVQGNRLESLGKVDAARTAYAQALENQAKARSGGAAAEQAVAESTNKLAKLSEAADSAAAALEAVGEDAELAALLEVLRGRVASMQVGLPPLQQAVSDQAAAAEAAGHAVTAAYETLRSEQLAAEQAIQVYQVAARSVQQMRLASDQANARLAREEATIQQARLLLEMEAQRAVRDRARQQLLALQEQQSQRSEEQRQLNQQTQLLGERLQAAEGRVNELSGQSQEVVARLDLVQSRAQRLIDARSALASVASLIPKPDNLTLALTDLESALTTIEGERSAGQQQLAELQAATEAPRQELALLLQQRADQAVRVAEVQQSIDQAARELAACQDEIADCTANLLGTLPLARQLLVARFQSAPLRPLSPEQLGWSFLAVNQVYDNYVAKHRSELEAESPATEQQMQDAGFVASRQAAAVRRARAELQGNINHFVNLYGAGAGQPQEDFFATADQALYASNGGALFSWAAVSGNNLSARCLSTESAVEAAQLVYLGIFSRAPVASEVDLVERFLGQLPEQRDRLVQEMVWSLMASAEFRFIQ